MAVGSNIQFVFLEEFDNVMESSKSNGDADAREVVVKIDRIAALTAEAVIESSSVGTNHSHTVLFN